MIKFSRLIAFSLVIFSLLLLPSACKTSDVASYKAEELTLLAKSISPDCPAPSEGWCG
jgi:hypothetical protein